MFITLLFFGVVAVNSNIIKSPIEVITHVNSTVQFNCTIDAPNTHWIRYVAKNYYLFELLSSNIITNVTLDDAGVYLCTEVNYNSNEIHLFVVDNNNIICEHNINSLGFVSGDICNYKFKPDIINITCYVTFADYNLSYRKRLLIYANWTNTNNISSNDYKLTVNNNKNKLFSTLIIKATPAMHNSQFVYTLLGKSWTSPKVKILYYIYTHPKMYSISDDVECIVFTNLQCSYKWITPDNYVYNGKFLQNKNKKRYQCIVECFIKNKICTIVADSL